MRGPLFFKFCEMFNKQQKKAKKQGKHQQHILLLSQQSKSNINLCGLYSTINYCVRVFALNNIKLIMICLLTITVFS